jgi:hypothetical protein
VKPGEIYRRFGGIYCLHFQDLKVIIIVIQGRSHNETANKVRFMLVSCLSYSLTLKMEATYSFETWADFHQSTWRYIPEERSIF